MSLFWGFLKHDESAEKKQQGACNNRQLAVAVAVAVAVVAVVFVFVALQAVS